MSISGIGKSLETSLFGSKKRVINTILTTVILFAVPITLQLTFQRQDVRQRAAGTYPDGCPNNYTVNGTTYSNACTNLQCSQLGMVPYQGAGADTACQGINWATGQPYGQRCCTQPGSYQPPPACTTGNACQVAGQVYGSADPKGYYKCDGHCWTWIDCPAGQTFNGLTCSASTTPVCTYGSCSVSGQVYGSTDAQGYYKCDGSCYQWQNCPTGQTYNAITQTCVSPTVSCPVLRPDPPANVICSGTTVSCSWSASTVPNATSWSAQILLVDSTTLATTVTCSSASPNSNCTYNASTKTLIQSNVPNGSYKCGVGGIGTSTCAAGPIGYSGVCLIQTAPTASCTDGIKNGTETDVDCGGGTCTICAAGKTCHLNSDCLTGLTCTNGVCTAPAPQQQPPSACTPTTCAAQGKSCGTISDNCGGTLTCGAACPSATPTCNGTIVCSGQCTAPANTCSNNNGTKSSCKYTTYNGSSNCTQANAADQQCTASNCTSPSICTNGACVTPTPTNTPTPTSSPTPAAGTANIAISVTLPGIGTESYNNNAPRAARAVTVGLYQAGGNQKIKDTTGNLSYQNGKYTGNVSVTNITPGSYYVKVRLDNTQYKKNTASAIAAGANSITFSANLVSGDIFNTNSLGLQEYNALVNCYNGGECSADTRTKADLNDDGSVDAKDINIVLVEFARGYTTGD